MTRIPQIVAFALLLAGIATPSNACSMAMCLGNGVEMRPDFIVTIRHADKPLAGVSVKVASRAPDKDEVVWFSGVTGADGRVQVTNLAPGNYWIETDLLGISAGEECFHVSEKPERPKSRLKYDWGDLAPASRRIAGRVVDYQPGTGETPILNNAHRVEVAIPAARLLLQNPITGATLSTSSDSSGSFSFDEAAPGVYVLHIDPGTAPGNREYDASDVLIRLAASATRNAILLSRREASGGSCGGTYLELQSTSN
jgi:hypothetical protein